MSTFHFRKKRGAARISITKLGRMMMMNMLVMMVVMTVTMTVIKLRFDKFSRNGWVSVLPSVLVHLSKKMGLRLVSNMRLVHLFCPLLHFQVLSIVLFPTSFKFYSLSGGEGEEGEKTENKKKGIKDVKKTGRSIPKITPCPLISILSPFNIHRFSARTKKKKGQTKGVQTPFFLTYPLSFLPMFF